MNNETWYREFQTDDVSLRPKTKLDRWLFKTVNAILCYDLVAWELIYPATSTENWSLNKTTKSWFWFPSKPIGTITEPLLNSVFYNQSIFRRKFSLLHFWSFRTFQDDFLRFYKQIVNGFVSTISGLRRSFKRCYAFSLC